MLRAMTAGAFAMATTITSAAADTPPGWITAGDGQRIRCPGAAANYFSGQSETDLRVITSRKVCVQ